MSEKNILIVGGGLVGATLGMFLRRAGHSVVIYERHQDLRQISRKSGRSINITLCTRGLEPLSRLGIRERVEALGLPALGRVMHSEAGELNEQPYGNHGETLFSVPRNPLNAELVEIAEKDFGVGFEFGMECLEIDPDRPAARFRCAATGEVRHLEPDVIFGADGTYSTVRMTLQKRIRRFDLSQQHHEQGYKELLAPPTASGDSPLDPGALHIWPRGRYMLIGFANPDRSFTLALHLPFEGEPSLASIRTGDDLVGLFRRSFPDALPLLPNLVEQFFEHKTASMATVRCFPWIHGGKVALIGDAAHAIVPSYGQGANSGFEDCAVLAGCLENAGDDWAEAFEEYQRLRKANTDAMAQLALDHFYELRDHVGDETFLLRKKLERILEACPGVEYTPLYNLVSFTTLPYIEALEVERHQKPLVERLLETESIEERIASQGIESVLEEIFATDPELRDRFRQPALQLS